MTARASESRLNGLHAKLRRLRVPFLIAAAGLSLGLGGGVKSEVPTQRIRGLVNVHYYVPPGTTQTTSLWYGGVLIGRDWVLTPWADPSWKNVEASMFGKPPQQIPSDASHRFTIRHPDGTPVFSLLRLPTPFKDRGDVVVSMVKLPALNTTLEHLKKALCFGNGGKDSFTSHHYWSADFAIRSSLSYSAVLGAGDFGARVSPSEYGGPCFDGDDSLVVIGLLANVSGSGTIIGLRPYMPAIQSVISH